MSRWVLLCAALCASGCQSSPERPDTQQTEVTMQPSEEPFVGAVEREEILRSDSKWAAKFEATEVDVDIAAMLATVEPGASIQIVLAVWCGDSRREVTRWWKALDVAGDVPFTVETIGVGRDFGPRAAELGVIAVPTFIVYRDGVEVGRVIETSPNGIELDVMNLLTGAVSGPISASR